MDVVKQTKDNKNHTTLDIGQALIAARESKNLSAQDIAAQMNLTLTVINKIESNEFLQETPLAFIRGYVRSYACKVHADVETLCVEFDRQTQGSSEPVQKINVVTSFKKSRKREINSNSSVIKLITYIIVISLLAFAGWEAWKRYGLDKKFGAVMSNDIVLNTSTTDSISDPQLDSEGQIIELDLASPDETLSSEFENSQTSNDLLEEDLQSESTQELIVADDHSEQQSELAQGVTVEANFVFTDNCWVKVTDAKGEVLAVGEKKAGKIMPLTGLAPLSVILGNPSAVKLTLEGDDFDLSVFPSGRTARFELGSSF